MTARDAVTTTRIHLYDISALGPDEATITLNIPLILSRADGRGNRRPKARVSLKVVRGKGLLDPFEPVRFKVPKALDGRRHIPDASSPRGVDHELQFVTDDFAHPADNFDIAATV